MHREARPSPEAMSGEEEGRKGKGEQGKSWEKRRRLKRKLVPDLRRRRVRAARESLSVLNGAATEASARPEIEETSEETGGGDEEGRRRREE